MKKKKKFTYQEKKNLPKGSFVYPAERKYPIPDIAHARNALARIAQFGTPAQQSFVRRAVYARFPQLRKGK